MKGLVASLLLFTAMPAVAADVIGYFDDGNALIALFDRSAGACSAPKWKNAWYQSIGPGTACWAIDKNVVAVCPVVGDKIDRRGCWYIEKGYFLKPPPQAF